MNIHNGFSAGEAGAAPARLAGKVVAVTGASGMLGRFVVPALAAEGAELLLCGRDPALLATLFPGRTVCSNDAFAAAAAAGHVDAVVDLAVMNNTASARAEAFQEVNYRRFVDLAEQCRRADIPVLVGISSTHAEDPDDSSEYATSKRSMQQWAESQGADLCRIVILPKVVATGSSGLRSTVWRYAAALKPVSFVEDAVGQIVNAVADYPQGPRVRSPANIVSPLYSVLSRLMDVGFALGVLVVGLVPMLLIALAVRLDSAGPAIFAQQRLGRDEKLFTLYKFRTMATGTLQAGTHEISGSSVTRVGSALRRLKLDELPQAINMLKGELALVGPRPCLPQQTELVETRRRNGIFVIRPGLTGLAQVNDIDMSDPAELVRWELRYLRLRGILLDLRIVVQTFLGRGGGDRTAA